MAGSCGCATRPGGSASARRAWTPRRARRSSAPSPTWCTPRSPGLATPGGVDRWLTSDHESADTVRLALRAAIVSAALDLGVVPWGRSSTPAAAVRVNATVATEDPGATVSAARAAVDGRFHLHQDQGRRERLRRRRSSRVWRPCAQPWDPRSSCGSTSMAPGTRRPPDSVSPPWPTSTLPTWSSRSPRATSRRSSACDAGRRSGSRRMSRWRRGRRRGRYWTRARWTCSSSSRPAWAGRWRRSRSPRRPTRRESGSRSRRCWRRASGWSRHCMWRRRCRAMPGRRTDSRRRTCSWTICSWAGRAAATPSVMTLGRITVPSGPGLGIALDADALDRWTIERVEGAA